MATYAVESARQSMLATGIVEPVMAWIEEGGKRRPSKDAQDHDPQTRLPLWGVEVMYTTAVFNRQMTVTAKVTVGAAKEPVVQPLTPVTFHDLTVDAGVSRSGGFFERWRARELDQFTPVQQGKAAGGDKPASGEKAA